MKKAKENSGITLITVIIAVVIMIILISVGTNVGKKSYKEAKIMQFITKMQLIQSKVDELVANNEYNELGTAITAQQKTVLTNAYNNNEISDNSNDYFNEFKYFNSTNLANLDLENIDIDVLINFSTREVVSIDGIEYEDTIYYTQYKLPNGQSLIYTDNTREDDIDFAITKKMNGLNCLITITNLPSNGKLTYGEGTSVANVTNWQTISNCTKSSDHFSINIAKNNTYIFKLQDNTDENSIVAYSVAVVPTNSPNAHKNFEISYDYAEDIENWCNIDKKIWIPRFAYNQNDSSQIKYIKGNSNIATDNTYIDMQNWEVPSIFTQNNVELTGIWIRKTDLNNKMEEFSEQIENMDSDIEKVAYIIRNTNILGNNELNSTVALETEVFGLEGEIEYDGTNYNRTTIALFSQENISKDFIIEFNVNSVDIEDVVDAPTLLGAMDEDSSTNMKNGKRYYPGFNVKVEKGKGLKLETNSFKEGKHVEYIPTETRNVRIMRMDCILYYSFDGRNFIQINDYTDWQENINPFDAPVIFGAGLDANGNPRRFFKGIIEDVSIRFINEEATLEDYASTIIDDPTPVLTTVYEYAGAIEFIPDSNENPSQMIDVQTGQALPVTEYQKNGMIYTGLSMFEETTIDKDFEISFVIKKIATKSEGQVGQGAIVNVKYEKKGWKKVDWPGFVYRLTKDCTSVELTARGHTSGSGTSNTIAKLNPVNEQDSGRLIKISRRDRQVFFSIDGNENMVYDFTNFNAFFDNVPITIGGSLNNEGVTNQPFRGFKGVLSNIVVKAEE